MSRRPCSFREADLRRAVRAAKAAGGSSVEVDPATGKITVRLGSSDEVATQADGNNEWEDEIAKLKGKAANR